MSIVGMDLLHLFDELDECRDQSSITEKRIILEEILSSENAEIFKDIVSFVYNPYRKSHIRVTDDLIFFSNELLGKHVGNTDSDIWASFKSLLYNLETRALTGNQARNKVSQFFSIIPDEYTDYFVGIINKDLTPV